jgi:hypothetical protein
MNPLLKIVLSALLIFVISETAKRYSFAGSIIASIPLVSVLSMMWLYSESKDVEKIAQFSMDVFWLVIPSLLLFVSLPVLLLKFRIGFFSALTLSIAATSAGYLLMIFLLKKFGNST